MDSYLRAYDSENVALDITEDLQRLVGFKREFPQIQKNLANVLFMNILSYAFDMKTSRTLLKRLSHQGGQLSYCNSILRQLTDRPSKLDHVNLFDSSNFTDVPEEKVVCSIVDKVHLKKDGNVVIKDGIFTFNNSRLRVTGKSIHSLPDYNFKIELKFKTKQANCGLFSFDFHGHDRHFFLKAGKPNQRVWKGGGWSVNDITSLNDNEWHHWVLTCKTGEGQTMIIDGKQVGTNGFDHSDFYWKEEFYLGFSADEGSKFTG